MRRSRFTTVVIGGVLAVTLAGFMTAASQVGTAELQEVFESSSPGLKFNPLQVAILRWYPANQAGHNFSVGESPVGVAFDGANIWVANSNSDTITKLRASDGATLGTFAVGDVPEGVAFDGANIWVANSEGATVSKR